MGIVNVTPDSFSDGGQYFNCDLAIAKGLDLIQNGAHILDFGGVSTNPKIENLNITAEEEFSRVYPVLKQARNIFPKHILISIDTYSPQVAHRLASEGLIDIINDIYAGCVVDEQFVSTMHVAAEFNLGFIAMHAAAASDAIPFLKDRIKVAKNDEVPFISIDPGIGYGRFGKNLQDILDLLSENSINQLCDLGVPLLIGISRKSFFEDLFPELNTPTSRDKITKEFEFKCIEFGAKIIRSHRMPGELLR